MTDDNNNKKPIPRRLYFAIAAVKTTLKKKNLLYLVIWKDTCVSDTMDVTVNFPLKIWHSPAKINEEQANTVAEFKKLRKSIKIKKCIL